MDKEKKFFSLSPTPAPSKYLRLCDVLIAKVWQEVALAESRFSFELDLKSADNHA